VEDEFHIADRQPIAIAQLYGNDDAFIVQEGAVGRAEILQPPAAAIGPDAGMFAGDAAVDDDDGTFGGATEDRLRREGMFAAARVGQEGTGFIGGHIVLLAPVDWVRAGLLDREDEGQ
jgi:hypothetical protein